MRGHSRPKDGVLSHAYDPRIHDALQRARTLNLCRCWGSSWIAGSSPAMTLWWGDAFFIRHSGARWKREPGIQKHAQWLYLDSGSGAGAPSRNDARIVQCVPTVMAGHSRPKDGVLSHAYVLATHIFLAALPWRRGCPQQVRAWRL